MSGSPGSATAPERSHSHPHNHDQVRRPLSQGARRIDPKLNESMPGGWRTVMTGARRLAVNAIAGIGAGFSHTGRLVQEAALRLHPAGEELSGLNLADWHFEHNLWAQRIARMLPYERRRPGTFILMCMDPDLHASAIFANYADGTFDQYRSPGSVLSPEGIESAALAVIAHRISVIMITRHTNCAMEAVAADPEKNGPFPMLTRGVQEREQRIFQLITDARIFPSLDLRLARAAYDSLSASARSGLQPPGSENGSAKSRTVQILPVVIDKVSKAALLDEQSPLFPLLEKAYPAWIDKHRRRNRLIAGEAGLDLEQLFARACLH